MMRPSVVMLFSLAAALPAQVRPRLVVLVSVDQMAEWVYAQAAPFLAADGGFRRLAERGVTFRNCEYEHACTETGPGHATIGTGAPAMRHGIVKNLWWDRALGKSVYCVGEPAEALADLPEGKDRGPGHLLVPTLADSLKAHVAGSRVASVSWKDRSAILMAGASADVVVWFETSTGNLVSNKNWLDETPAWLAEFNAAHRIDSFFGQSWDRVGPESAYAGLVDDRRYESAHRNGSGQRTLPQPLTGGEKAPGKAYYAQLYASPFGNTAVRHAAEAALRGMQLGKDEVPDLLCVSFSSTDVVGHAFGPDSVEARDTLLRLDRELAALFRTFDEEVGEGLWAVFVTADHGVGPTPDAAREHGVAAGRGPIDAWVRSAAEAALKKEYGPLADGERYVLRVSENTIYLNEEVVADRRLFARRVAARAAAKVRAVMTAYATDDIVDAWDHGDPIRRALANALLPARAGDVQFVLRPYWVNGGIPATHGSPHAYDREVIGFAYGPGLPPGRILDAPITPGFGVVLFAKMLHVPKPTAAHEKVMPGLLPVR